MKGISIKGIVIAIVAVLLTDGIAAVMLFIVLGRVAAQSTAFLIGSVILGNLTTVLGGYIAARIAKTSYYKNAFIIGMLGVLCGIITASQYPLWFNVICFLTVVPAAILGGHFAKPSGERIP